MKTLHKNATILSFFIFSSLFTQAQFTVTGEFRPTAEVRSGYKSLNAENKVPSFLVTQRTRIGFQYQMDDLKTMVSFQDARIWGDETSYSSSGILGDAASIEVNEAWLQWSMSEKSALKIGRQYFEFDDTRLLSARNWNVQSVKYDALAYQYHLNKLTVDAAISYNNQADNTFGNLYPSAKMKTLNFVHAAYTVSENLKAALILLGSGYMKSDTSETIYMRGTYGLYADYHRDDFKGMASVYYQNGKNKKGTELSAYNFNVKADYTLQKFAFGLGATFVSGDEPDSPTDNGFDLLYGNRHSYYGLMDIFTNMPVATKNGGLNDYFVNLKIQASEKLNLQLDYHAFSLNQNVVKSINNGITAYYDQALGSEFDLHLKWKLSKIMEMAGGYSLMSPSSTLRNLQGINETDKSLSSWVWLQLTVKPTFFISK